MYRNSRLQIVGHRRGEPQPSWRTRKMRKQGSAIQLNRRRRSLNTTNRIRVRSSLTDVADHFKIPLGTVKTIWHNRVKTHGRSDNRMRNRNGKYHELEQEVLQFVSLARSLRLPVTCAVISLKAQSLRAKYNISETKFSASNGWVFRFCQRSGIGDAVRLWGEAGSVDASLVHDEMIQICQKLQKYSPDRIYNQDETGFWYQLLPNVSYLTPGESQKDARGTKAMRSKARVTLSVSANAAGTHVLPPYIIGKSKKPVCFGLASALERRMLERTYISQKCAWMDGKGFAEYLKFWVSEVRKKTSDDVCLILDNCSAHGSELPNFSGVEFLFLPPNVTSVYQPLDQGTLRKVKLIARKILLLRIMKNAPDYHSLRSIGAKLRNGMRGVDYCYPAHMLDAIRAMWESFESLTAKEVTNCWLKAGILSTAQTQLLCQSHERELPEELSKTIGVEACGDVEVQAVAAVELSRDKRTTDMDEDKNELLELVDTIFEADLGVTPDQARAAIRTWVEEYHECEQPPIELVHATPEVVVTRVDEEQIRQNEEQEEREQILLNENEHDVVVDTGKRTHEELRNGADCLAKAVEECEGKLTREAHARLVDALRVARLQEREAAPRKKQKAIAFRNVTPGEAPRVRGGPAARAAGRLLAVERAVVARPSTRTTRRRILEDLPEAEPSRAEEGVEQADGGDYCSWLSSRDGTPCMTSVRGITGRPRALQCNTGVISI
eukprot:IDg21868t1